MEQGRSNPFIVGDWIKEDKDFIGRRDLLDQFFPLQRRGYWLIGSRRMGKTSLLRCLQRRFRSNRQTLPIFWDVSGSDSSRDLQATLRDSLDASHADLQQRNLELDLDRIAEEDLHTLLRTLSRTCRVNGLKLILLIDEAEALFKVMAQYPLTMQKFKSDIDSEHLHVILASNHGLENYDPIDTEHLLSPLLQSFVPAYFLPAWRDDEARLLAARCTPDPEEQDQILSLSGGLPFLVQMVCFYRFELGSLAASIKMIQERQMLDLFFRYDMEHLGSQNSRMLGRLAHRQPMAYAALSRRHLAEGSWSKRVALLQQLGFIALDADQQCRISNVFLRDWLCRMFMPSTSVIESPVAEKKQHRLWLEADKDSMKIIWNGQEVAMCGRVPADEWLESDRSVDPRSRGKLLFRRLFLHPFLQELQDRLAAENDFFTIYVFDPEGAAVPYEWLHDRLGFLALRHVMVRTGAAPAQFQDHPWITPVRILLIAANTPPDIPRVDQELLLIREQLQLLSAEMKCPIMTHCLFSHQSDLATVMNLMAKESFQMIHYAGHAQSVNGSADHLLYFKRSADINHGVQSVLLSEWLQDLPAPVPFVHINGCGEKAIRAVPNTKPLQADYILSNRATVLDEWSTRFAVEFYRCLYGQGLGPAEALLRARQVFVGREAGDPFGGDHWLLPILWQQK